MAQPIDPTATSANSELSHGSKTTSAKTTKAAPVQAVTDVIAASKSRRKKGSNVADASMEQAIATVASKETTAKTPTKRRTSSKTAHSANAAVDMAVQMAASNAIVGGTAKASKKALEQELGDLVTNAQSSMRNAKDSAIQAAVYCFRFWLRTQSADAAKWYAGAVEARNKLIKSDNGEIDERMRKADQYKNNKLPASDLANEVAYDEVHAKQIAAHKAKYEADAGRPPQNGSRCASFWSRRSRVQTPSPKSSSSFSASKSLRRLR
ncbi:hypothetical protein HYN69_04640 [Gemmobacter aquarius]|uniref:Uncharacterized protein n=1 Tax=Paragemmobacter aquarius TaxID=2169400 RepID=A0A2S0UJ87_9RHOB|nr:hypothetical protein [Gemmobacter aquarius]AWB47892.1 hypothetical protein HYN69_04640 [Gemmobacter aquarius]